MQSIRVWVNIACVYGQICHPKTDGSRELHEDAMIEGLKLICVVDPSYCIGP